MLTKQNPNHDDTSYLAELMYHQAQNNVMALNHEINTFVVNSPEDAEKLYRLCEIEKEAQSQAWKLSQMIIN
jgi:hypothetical protein